MDTTPFRVYYVQNDALFSAEIRPCCNEDNIVDYAVWNDGQLDFTITRPVQGGKWVVALKNADDDIDDERVQLIGAQIEKKIAENE